MWAPRLTPLLCLSALFFCSPLSALAATTVSNDITTDTEWTLSGSPYVVPSDLTVAPGATLTIDPAVRVQVGPRINITVAGALVAPAGAAPTVFTSTSDTPDSSWGHIVVKQYALAILSHVHLRYGGGISPGGGGDFVAYVRGVIQNDGTLTFNDSTIENTSFSTGIDSSGVLTFSHSSIHNVYTGPGAPHALPALDLSGTTTISNSIFGTEEVIRAIGADVTFSGSSVTEPVAVYASAFHDGGENSAPVVLDWNSIGSTSAFPSTPFVNLAQYLPVDTGSTLTISPGAVVKVLNSIDVSGTLVVGSSGGATTTLTSYADDIGGHTSPVDISPDLASVWYGIVAEEGSTVTLAHASARYAGDPSECESDACFAQVTNLGGSVSISDSTFASPTYRQITQYAGETVVAHSQFSGGHIFAQVFGGSLSVGQSSITQVPIGIDNQTTADVNATSNWWGNASGPLQPTTNPSGAGPSVSAHVTFVPWLTSDPFATSSASNVFFLPGIEGSRLYRPDYNGGTDQLWEPNIDSDVKDLYLNPDGTSQRFDVYTKERGVIDELADGENIYKSFISKMDALKSSGAINDWEPAAYDWRLSLDDILNYGRDVNGRIYYSGDLRATSTPYIIQELRRLAASSKTGKVTIVAHSNGGLVTKRLTELLGPAESLRLIDKIIFVAVPQVGTPAAVAAGLHGYDQDLLKGFLVKKSTARTFASTSPMFYHLLPSATYFTYVDDPVVTFDPTLTDWIAKYGDVIHSEARLETFLTGDYRRVDSQTGDINQPIQLSESLLLKAEALHDSLDTWTPPPGVQLTQIAGWGMPATIKGILYKKKGAGVAIDAEFTVDGDGTVVVPSALWTSTTTGATNYWMRLNDYNKAHPFLSGFGSMLFDHPRILETDSIISFVSDQILHTIRPLSDYQFLSDRVPVSSNARLRYALHSPLTLNLYDDQGRHTGVSTTTGEVEEQIPGTYYSELGDVKYLFSDASTTAHIVMNGYAPGTFTFNVDQYSGDTSTASSTFQDMPTTASTTVSLSVQSDITTLSPMSIDKDGDGTPDYVIPPAPNGTVTLDLTPPEIQIAFSTTTNALAITATDDTSTTTLSVTVTPPAPKARSADVTVTASDAAGNTTKLVYTQPTQTPHGRISITPRMLVYNTATTTISNAALSYKWRLSSSTPYSIFASYIKMASTTIETHYRPDDNQTYFMPNPHDLDDSDSDPIDTLRTKLTLSGLVIPHLTTQNGAIITVY